VEKVASAVRRLLTEQLSPVHSAQC
jgi:hypothetical protein